MMRVPDAAPLADVEYCSEVQVSNPPIRVQHLRNGLAFVLVGRLEPGVVPDNGNAVRDALDVLLAEYRATEFWR